MISMENAMYFTAGAVFTTVCIIASDSKKRIKRFAKTWIG